MARKRYYYNPETGHYDLNEEQHAKMMAKKRNEERAFSFALMGNGFPSKRFSIENKQKKALQDNPNHTTMRDYKPSNPDSIVSKARKKNKKHLRSKGLNIEQQVTKK